MLAPSQSPSDLPLFPPAAFPSQAHRGDGHLREPRAHQGGSHRFLHLHEQEGEADRQGRLLQSRVWESQGCVVGAEQNVQGEELLPDTGSIRGDGEGEGGVGDLRAQPSPQLFGGQQDEPCLSLGGWREAGGAREVGEYHVGCIPCISPNK